MLGSIIYFSLDIIFNILLWSCYKTASGFSMLYYYYYDIPIEEKGLIMLPAITTEPSPTFDSSLIIALG